MQALRRFRDVRRALRGAAWSCAGPQSLNPQLIVQIVQQHPLEPLTARAANDCEVEVLILRVLMISRP
jgi:hypothetical protein